MPTKTSITEVKVGNEKGWILEIHDLFGWWATGVAGFKGPVYYAHKGATPALVVGGWHDCVKDKCSQPQV